MIVGSLFSGAGLLDAGLHQAGIGHAWFVEREPDRRALLERRFPGVPVHDDVRTVGGDPVTADADEREQRERSGPRASGRAETGSEGEARADLRQDAGGVADRHVLAPVDAIVGGFPCKGASNAGPRTGLDHPETALWAEFERIVRELRPRYVGIENVAAIRSIHSGAVWGTVLGDLAALGYDVAWGCVRASDVGAPHGRDRIFAVARHAADVRPERAGSARLGRLGLADAGSSAADADSADGRGRRPGGWLPAAARAGDAADVAVDWGGYEPAVRRWEAIHGPAPAPLSRVRGVDDGGAKLHRLRARLDRQRLSALGDGVHVYVARLVGEALMELYEQDQAVAA